MPLPQQLVLTSSLYTSSVNFVVEGYAVTENVYKVLRVEGAMHMIKHFVNTHPRLVSLFVRGSSGW